MLSLNELAIRSLLTLPEASHLTGAPVSLLKLGIRNGLLTGARVGNATKVLRSEAQRFAERLVLDGLAAQLRPETPGNTPASNASGVR